MRGAGLIRDLLINFAVIVSFVSLLHQAYLRLENLLRSKLLIKTAAGVTAGIVGILLMLTSVHFAPTIILDFRSLPFLLCFLYGGILPGIISGVIIGGFRIFYFGFMPSSFAALAVLLVSGVIIAVISRVNTGMKRKQFFSVLTYLIAGSVGFISVVPSANKLAELLAAFWLGTAAAAFLLFRYVDFLESIRSLFKQYRSEAEKDFLTGLYNVRQFDQRLNEAVNEAHFSGGSLSLLFLDLDQFKDLNDSRGHQNGDKILKDFSEVLFACLRQNDVVSRNGGDEFSVILRGCGTTKAVEVAERIRSAIEAHPFTLLDGAALSMTVSIGIASFPNSTRDTARLIQDADAALYTAKQAGRNRVVLSNRKMETPVG